MNNLNLQRGERLVVHRGESHPICPFVGGLTKDAEQARDGFNVRVAGLMYGIVKPNGEIGLKLHDISKLRVKNVGKPNALIKEAGSPFDNWWVHVVKVDGIDFGLVGRPNCKRYGNDYGVYVPHLVSTTIWREVLQCLTDQAKEYRRDVQSVKYPSMAAAFDSSRSGIERSFLESI